MGEFPKRVLTACLGGILFLSLLFFAGDFGPHLVAAVLSAFIAHELSQFFFESSKKDLRAIALFFSFTFPLSHYFFPSALAIGFVLGFGFLGCLFTFKAHRVPEASWMGMVRDFTAMAFILIYSAGFLVFLPLVSESRNGFFWLVIFLIINWGGDTAAYFAGKHFGKRPLTPLSPKKTIEGAGAGFLASVGGSVLYLQFFSHKIDTPPLIAVITISAFCAAASQVGDIFESLLKRSFQVKDSGSLLPGHGGFLDRFDGFLFSLPILYGCIQIWGE